MAPYKIVPGEFMVSRLSCNISGVFPIGMAALCFNLPLSLLGRVLGAGFGLKNVYLFYPCCRFL